MAQPPESLTSLAATIAETAQAITAYLEKNKLPGPSFDEDGLRDYPKDPEVFLPRLKLLSALTDMLHLALGPHDVAFVQPLLANHDTMILDILNQFDFFAAVPLGGAATYAEVARAVHLPESLVRRVLRHALTMHFFAERPVGSGRIVHTAASAILARTPSLRSCVSHHLEECRPATVQVPASLKQFAAGRDAPSEQTLQAGFALADLDRVGRPMDYWEWVAREAEGQPDARYRANRFAQVMETAASASSISPMHVLREGLDWASLGGGTVVDVGGSTGHDATQLAQVFPHLQFVVQDQPALEARFQATLPAALRGRVVFQPHDFFTPQTRPADVFILKTILHDWPDQDAQTILANLLPGLQHPGSRILLCESVAPPPAVATTAPWQAQRIMSAADLQMLALFNSRERTLEDWKRLLARVDERLEVRHVASFPGALWSAIEVALRE